MPERMKPYSLSAFLLLLFAYLGVQALTGERGLLSGHARDALLAERESQLTELSAKRADLEVRAVICVPTVFRAICWRNAPVSCSAFPTPATM